MTQKFDQNQKIASLRREKHLLLMKVEELEATHTAELEAKEREIRGLKRKLEEKDNTFSQWKREKGLLYTVKDELRKMRVKELLTKVSELEGKLEIHDNTISQRIIDKNEQVGGFSGVSTD